jgi:hypothetical protein
MFLLLFLVVRGTPALLLYRGILDRHDRVAFAFLSSTQLPLVVAITAVATSSGHMRPSTAASLVAAAAISTLIFPMLGLEARRRGLASPSPQPDTPPAPSESPATSPSKVEAAVRRGALESGRKRE